MRYFHIFKKSVQIAWFSPPNPFSLLAFGNGWTSLQNVSAIITLLPMWSDQRPMDMVEICRLCSMGSILSSPHPITIFRLF